MTEKIVPQTEPFCKVQNNPKVNTLIRVYSGHKDHYYNQCARILALGNDKCVEFLEKAGFTQIIPGTHFALLYDMAEFFGVHIESLYSRLTQHGFGKNHDPRESLVMDIGSFFHRSGLIKYGHVVVRDHSGEYPQQEVFDFHFNDSDYHFVTKYVYSGRMFTVRAYLSMLPFVCKYYSRHNTDGRYKHLYASLMKFVAECEDKEKARKATEKAVVAPVVEKSVPTKQPSEQVSAGNMTSVAEDLLYQMVKRAVAEIMSGATIAIAAPTANT